jgi:hypothetical protein
MSELLEQFVHSSLDAMDGRRTEIGLASGVWRAELPPSAARFLGRTQHDILYTFDQARWEEGARLECLNRHSGLVQRLRAYASARGGVAVAHVRDDSPAAVYQPYLAARFHASLSAGVVRKHSRWLAVNLTTDAPVKIKGDPLTSIDLVEGPPPSAAMPSPGAIERGIERLTDQWNRAVAQNARELQAAAETRYTQEAADIVAAKNDVERDVLLKRLQERLQITAECRLEMALLLWLLAR